MVQVVVFGDIGGVVVMVDWYVDCFLVGVLYQCWQIVVYVVEIWQVQEGFMFEQFDVIVGIGGVVVQYVCMDCVGLFVGLVFVVVVLVVDLLVGEQFYLWCGCVMGGQQFGDVGWVVLVVVVQCGDLWCMGVFDVGVDCCVLVVLVDVVQYLQFWVVDFQVLQYCQGVVVGVIVDVDDFEVDLVVQCGGDFVDQGGDVVVFIEDWDDD